MATSEQLEAKEEILQHKGFLIAPSGYKEKVQPKHQKGINPKPIVFMAISDQALRSF